MVRDRGAAVFHELRTAMGRDELLSGLKLFYEKGLQADVLTEMDLVSSLDAASGESWEAFLTDWVYNIGTTVLNGGVSMVIFFFVNKIIFPEAKKE